MGTRFFKIVGGFSYALAALALTVAVITGLNAAAKYFGGVDKQVSAPELSLEDYHESVKPEEEKEQTDTAESGAQSSTEKENPNKERVDSLIKDLVNLIWKYQEVTKQQDVTREQLERGIYQATDPLKDEKSRVDFLEDLNQAFERDLVEPANNDDEEILAKNIPGLNASNQKYIKWADYLNWYVSRYMDAYQDELARIQQEKQQKIQERSDAIAVAITSGSAFLIFVFATLILLLVRIEYNTRTNSSS